jgi:hypothetical protein
MPTDVADTFTDKQLVHLKSAIDLREWGKHKIDFRGILWLNESVHRYEVNFP